MKEVFMGSISNSFITRQRSNEFDDDGMNKKKGQKGKVWKEMEKMNLFVLDKNMNCKFQPLKLVLFSIICVALLTFICSPSIHHEHQNHSTSRLVDIGWIFDRPILDPRYESNVEVNWHQIFTTLDQSQIPSKTKNLKIALLNFNSTETQYWSHIVPNSQISAVTLNPVPSTITWQILYPEWIDEEEETEIPSCPDLPEPEVPKKSKSGFDLIAVKLPCNRGDNWSRDVVRLHLQLSAAKLALLGSKDMNGKKNNRGVHVLFVSECFPIPNLFKCKDRLKRENNIWLFKPDLNMLRQKVRLPVGSCELAVPLKPKSRLYSVDRRREAYATILHSAQLYVCGAITAAQSIRQAGSTRDLVILVDESISSEQRVGLELAGWQVRTIKRIRNPKAERDAYNEWNYSKFRLWQLTDYDKIIFIDADLLILRNIDFLFAMPEITATGNDATLFNSGVMVVEPSNCTFELLMENINDITSYNGGDQGYLNEIFTWWHRIPRHMNFLKHFWEGDEESVKAKKTWLFAANPPVLYVLHYLGLKPWLCFRDYDCNWNVDIMREFASDEAHERWWRVHDLMPGNLQKFCLLRSKQKAGLEWDRRQAEKGNFTDGHWKIAVKDQRLNICFEKFCFWESMLWHWGEKDNSTSTVNPALPSL